MKRLFSWIGSVIGNLIAIAIMLLTIAIAITIFALLVFAIIYSWKNCILA